MILGFTGTSEGCSKAQLQVLEELLEGFRSRGSDWMHNGDCVGADASAGLLWKDYGGFVFLHPPTNTYKRAYIPYDMSEEPKPYLDRNRDIVSMSDTLVATPKEMTEQLRSGTWATVRYARRANKKIIIIFPDGSVQVEEGAK